MDRLGNIAESPSQDHSRLSSHPFAENPTEIFECVPPLEETSRQKFQRLTQSRFTPSPSPLPQGERERLFTPLPRGERVGERVTGDDVALGGIVLGVGWIAGGPIGLIGGAMLLVACAGSDNDQSRPSLAVDDSKMEGFRRIVQSDSYAGRLVVFFKEGRSAFSVQRSLIEGYPDIQFIRSTNRTPKEENQRRQELEARTGQKFLDWNRVYYVDVSDKGTAERLLAELLVTEGVSLVYPEQVKQSPSLATTPSLEGLQTYLQGPASAGMNITSAWDRRVFGAGVMVVDDDNGLNWEHEEFDLVRRPVGSGGDGWVTGCDPSAADDPRYFCESEGVAHGTATTGILHAQHDPDDNDEHGMRGIAPSAWTTIGSPLDPTNDLPKGSIYLWECAEQYSYDGRVTCEGGASGTACVPCSSPPLAYAQMREATYSGDVTILLTAGNGAINLDTTELINDATMEEICGGPRPENPEPDDCWVTSGAILVGASQGDRDMVSGQPRKESYSNCGEAVELYGWGERVVTTSWHPASGPLSNYEWVTVDGGPNPPNDDVNAYFTNEFGGTSAAAAMMAGAATLVQSYFKEVSGGNPRSPGSELLTRYLMPWKMKEILRNSGIETYSADGCGVGKQPQMVGFLRDETFRDGAFELVDDFWNNEVLPRFSELVDGRLASQERLDELNALGMGLGWGDRSNPPPPPIPCARDTTDSRCIENDWVPHLSKKMDVDEDGRGDLISWRRGEWKIDLSRGGLGSTGDNYGAWDVTLTYPPVSDWEVPVVMDYDSDGQADLAVYDRENGRWNIAVMGAGLLGGEWSGWTHTVDWPGIGDRNTYGDEWYTRPLPADYNGDYWTDLAVQTSDGHWKMNFDWRNAEDGWSGRRFEEYGPLIPSYASAEGIKDLAYLTAEELAAYPGWAYLPSMGRTELPFEMLWRGPEGITVGIAPSGSDRGSYGPMGVLGGMDDLPVVGSFGLGGGIGTKTDNGYWRYYSFSRREIVEPAPNGIFGNGDCKPVVADLDDDGLDDRTVMCANEWRVVYSSTLFAMQNDAGGVRRIPLSYTDPATLPGCPVFGGLSYERVEQVRDYMYNLGMTNIPPLFDYAMTHYEYCDLPWFVDEMPEECL